MNSLHNKPNEDGLARSFISAGAIRQADAAPAFQLDLLRSLKMHPMLASSVAFFSFVFILFYTFLMKPMYDVEALIYVQPDQTKLLSGNLNSTFDSGRYDSFLQQQIQTIQRADTISTALTTVPRSTWTEYGSSEQTAVQGILANLKVTRVTTSYQIALDLNGTNPESTAEMVNAIANTYLEQVHTQGITDTDERARLLKEERQRVSGELRAAQAEQSALAADLGIANPNGEGDPYESELADMRAQLVQARSAHDTAAAQLTSFTAQRDGHSAALAAAAEEAILGDSGLSSLKSSISERRATLSGQMAGMTAKNPLRQRDQEELADLDRALEETTAKLHAKAEQNLLNKLRADLQRTSDIEAHLNAQLGRKTIAATNATPKLQRATELNEQLKHLLLREAEIDDAASSLQFEASGPDSERLASAAQIPASPARSRKPIFLCFSFPLALFFGAAAAVVACKYDPRIYTAADVQGALGFPPLGVLPARNDVSVEVVDRYVLRLAGGIENAYCCSGARTFVLTGVSAQIEVGQLTRMLLKQFRQMGIEADRTTAEDLLLPRRPEREIEDQRFSVSELRNGESEVGEHQGFVKVNLARLKARKTLVLIETSTLVHSAETEYVARCADATILVAQCTVTTRDELHRAADLLQRLRVPGIGVVLDGLQMRYAGKEMRETSTLLERQTEFGDGYVEERSQRLPPVNEKSTSRTQTGAVQQCEPDSMVNVHGIAPISDDEACLTFAAESESRFNRFELAVAAGPKIPKGERIGDHSISKLSIKAATSTTESLAVMPHTVESDHERAKVILRASHKRNDQFDSQPLC